MNIRALTTVVLVAAATMVAAKAEERVLFQFDSPDAIKPWRAVNDGVMGGRSDGRVRIKQDSVLHFYGNLSLANNGGFASIRARGANLALQADDVVVARVRGDGREYKLNLYTQRNLRGYSYRQSFRTKRDEWIEVTFPVSQFRATWRGRTYPNEKLDPGRVSGLGFLLGDKKAGPFQLDVDWIKVASSATSG